MNDKVINLLLVEDDPGDAFLVKHAFAAFGTRFQTHHVTRLEDALAWLRASPCDVVLLDLSLPDSSGFATLARMAAAAPSLAIIILTGHDDDRLAFAAVEAGAQDYLVKGQADGELLKRSIGYAILRKQTEERLRAIVEMASDAIVVVDENRTILLFNPAAERMFGWDAVEMIGRSVACLVPAEAGDDFLHHFTVRAPTAAGSRSQATRIEITAQHRDGPRLPAEIGISQASSPKGTYFTAILHDISTHKKIESDLRQLATTDPLTGLANRRQFQEALTVEWQRVRRYHGSATVLMLDIDHFKCINDTYGHAAGDQALRSLAAELRTVLRSNDLPGRMGGEEFAVLLPETHLEAAFDLAERLREFIGRISVVFATAAFGFTVSIGVALVSGTDDTAEAALVRADEALYRAKQTGRNRVVCARCS